ncbi:HAD family phosphatase [Telluribacter sp. SYSU D00476]|uniref:HAD family hydrolase n=1 Tax=Telluribacter sp. SYSU D00476 TaxID=2811430 RepID=UPI001FF4A009|nr:HAD family phosphatase [Telluribacter sp. SYSU D00476]
MTHYKAIIFDLGNVLIDWNPNYLFDQIIVDPVKKKYFFDNVCTSDWNEEQDGGRLIKEATEDLVNRHPEWKEHIEAYYGRWTEMLGGPIHGSVDIFRELKDTGKYKFYALTNWSAELFPIALERYDFLHWFDGRVVSGEEKMRKPFPQFYQVLLDRYSLLPNEAVFIDDNFRNIKAAEALGIPSIHFQSPEQLRQQLQEMEVL